MSPTRAFLWAEHGIGTGAAERGSRLRCRTRQLPSAGRRQAEMFALEAATEIVAGLRQEFAAGTAEVQIGKMEPADWA